MNKKEIDSDSDQGESLMFDSAASDSILYTQNVNGSVSDSGISNSNRYDQINIDNSSDEYQKQHDNTSFLSIASNIRPTNDIQKVEDLEEEFYSALQSRKVACFSSEKICDKECEDAIVQLEEHLKLIKSLEVGTDNLESNINILNKIAREIFNNIETYEEQRNNANTKYTDPKYSASEDSFFSLLKQVLAIINKYQYLNKQLHNYYTYGPVNDGELTWVIKDVEHVLNNATIQKKWYLDSPPVYTSMYGFKMCARIFMNEMNDNDANDQYLSLGIIILKGYYDAVRRWPFKQKVKFILYDRSDMHEHISGEIVPEESFSTAFKRPKTDANPMTCGLPRFCSLETLKSNNNGYTLENKMLMRIQVEHLTKEHPDYDEIFDG